MKSLIGSIMAALLPVLNLCAAEELRFNRDVRPVLSGYCFQCHGPDTETRKAKLRLDERAAGLRVISPGNPDKSELIHRILSDDPDEVMPPPESKRKMSEDEKRLVTEWVRQGATYQKHWSYEKPRRETPPDVKRTSWPRNAIDHFILSRLEREGLRPAAPADPYSLIRRVSLDLTGLPPTWDQARSFAEEDDSAAYEKLVDRLLADSAYGERWGRVWLDPARYADSSGYADDPPRTIWGYRDWVIRALNSNMPFDQFTLEQIAGDLLPDPTDDQLVATAFHRNTMTNSEGGTNDEEFRSAAIVDRVNTTMAVWMGTTINCAQCHTHKYDPLTQEEFFKLYAIFNNTADADKKNETPTLGVFSEAQHTKRTDLERQIENLGKQVAAKELDVKGTPTSPELDKLHATRADLETQLGKIKPVTTVPVMRELPEGKRRKTRLQYRGSFMDLGPEVSEGVPAALHPLRADLPPNRLALAHWLTDPENPLTARVLANRYWETLFGIGLVRTSEEFGSQGEMPSHPELLDWLATEMVRLKWDMKAFLKTVVMSAAYRQSSRVTPELLDRDPANRLVARGPRFRLSAEMIRDQALQVSGLLSRKMYGPSVQPPRPSLGLKAAFGGSTDWETSPGEDQYRRGVYTSWRRSIPYPSMATFDAPSREVCSIRRIRTNTPLQALVTLNDPVYIEAAQAFARRIMAEGGDSVSARVVYSLREATCRLPEEKEVTRMAQCYESALARYAQDESMARIMAEDPIGKLPADLAPAEAAAWTVVANVILNLDELLSKR